MLLCKELVKHVFISSPEKTSQACAYKRPLLTYIMWTAILEPPFHRTSPFLHAIAICMVHLEGHSSYLIYTTSEEVRKKLNPFRTFPLSISIVSICVVPVRTLRCFWIRAFLFICCTGSFQWKERLLVQTYTQWEQCTLHWHTHKLGRRSLTCITWREIYVPLN